VLALTYNLSTWKLEDQEFKASLGYMRRPWLENKIKIWK
jgi:hypothetical protein